MTRSAHAGALWLGLALLLSACTAVPAADTASKGELIIASNAPTSGVERASGRGPEAGVAYAVQLNPTVKGFRITHLPYDDAINGVHDPQRGAQNFTDMASNAKVLGVVGPFNSNVARATIPIANKAELVMISPSNTLNCLTQDVPGCGPGPAAMRDATKPNNYFRIAGPDIMLGTAMADFAIDTLKISKVAVWSDSNPGYGMSIADTFAKRLQARGGAVVVRQDFPLFPLVPAQPSAPPDYRPFLLRARDAGAQGIFAGAHPFTGACIARAQSKGILDVYYLGPDSFSETQCIKDAADQASDKMYFTIAQAEPAHDPANKSLIDGFQKAFTQKDDLSGYTFQGYDCAKILIDAIGRAIDAASGNMPTRRQVLDAVQNTKNIKLSTGTYSFDANGDATSPTMAFYQLKNGVWTFVKQFGVGQ